MVGQAIVALEQELPEDIPRFYADPLGFVRAAYPWGERGMLEAVTGRLNGNASCSADDVSLIGLVTCQTEEQLPPVSEQILGLVQCPNCHSRLHNGSGSVECAGCGFVAPMLGSKVVGFRSIDYSQAKSIVDWPEEIADRIARGLTTNEVLPDEMRSLLASVGLVNSQGGLTPLGSHLQYNSLEYEWQKRYDVLEGLVALSDLPSAPRILDLGCGSGQTLRNLSLPGDALCIGIDYSAEALAYGSVLSRNGPADCFFCASAHDLPIRDQSFDLVISRAAMNYCHQQKFLQEAIRILRPGGLLFCRVEQVWWDLNVLSQTKSVLSRVYGVRNLFWGMLHQLTGLQPEPGGVFRGSRAYVHATRMKSILQPLGCEVLKFDDSSRGPQFRGRGTQAKVLCRRAT
jgi:hypothetical protein